MANELKQKQLKEALERMELMGLAEPIQKGLEQNIVYKSLQDGILDNTNEDDKKIIEDFEKKHKGLVYHIIETKTEFGLLKSLLYVSREKNLWKEEKEQLQQGYAFSYVVNVDEPAFSEFGTIGIGPSISGIMRWA